MGSTKDGLGANTCPGHNSSHYANPYILKAADFEENMLTLPVGCYYSMHVRQDYRITLKNQTLSIHSGSLQGASYAWYN